jgi:hypothetical protein
MIDLNLLERQYLCAIMKGGDIQNVVLAPHNEAKHTILKNERLGKGVRHIHPSTIDGGKEILNLGVEGYAASYTANQIVEEQKRSIIIDAAEVAASGATVEETMDGLYANLNAVAAEHGMNELKTGIDLVSMGDVNTEFTVKGLVPHGLTVFGGRPKSGKCLTGDTPVLLPDGRIMPIKQAVEDKEPAVMSVNDEGRTVPHLVKNWIDNGPRETWEVKTRTGRVIKVTSNHLLKTYSGWKSLDTGLAKGDYILAPRTIPIFGQEELDERVVKMLAFCYAGFSRRDDGGDSLWAEYQEIRTEWDGGSMQDFFDRYFTTAKPAHEAFNSVVFRLCKKSLKLFLSYYVSACAYIFEKYGGHTEVICYSDNAERLLQLNHLFLRFGIVGQIRDKQVVLLNATSITAFLNDIGLVGDRASYKPTLAPLIRNYVEVFPNEMKQAVLKRHTWGECRCFHPARPGNIGLYAMEKFAKDTYDRDVAWGLHSEMFYDKIASIAPLGTQPTYCLEMERYPNFLAGDIVSHNSFLLLDMARNVAEGRPFLGVPTERAPVLYYTLEDNLRRCAHRLNVLFSSWGPGLFFRERSLGGYQLMDDIKKTGAKLVIIDTFFHYSPVDDNNSYSETTNAIRSLKDIADIMHVSIVSVHHTNKGNGDGSNPMSSINGSQGIVGAADAVWVLNRQPDKPDGTLFISGRDIQDLTQYLTFMGGKWTVKAPA